MVILEAKFSLVIFMKFYLSKYLYDDDDDNNNNNNINNNNNNNNNKMAARPIISNLQMQKEISVGENYL